MKPSTIPAYVAFSVTAAVIAGGVAATGIRCAGAHPAAVAPRGVIAANSAKPKASAAPDRDPIQGSYSGSGGLTAEQRDPRHPEIVLWKLLAKGVNLDHPDKSITGVLTGVTATLYQKGKPSAIMQAPVAHGDSVLKQIVASGGAIVRALGPTGQPDGRKLTADNVVWKAKTGSRADQIIARGHVVYTDQASGMTIRCPQLITDSHLKTLSSSNGDMDLNGAILKRK